MPILLIFPPRGHSFQINHLAPPGFVILWFGQHVSVPHPVQQGKERGPFQQKINWNIYQLGQGRIEQLKPATVIKNGQTGCKFGKGVGQGLLEILQGTFHQNNRIRRNSIADHPFVNGAYRNIKPP